MKKEIVFVSLVALFASIGCDDNYKKESSYQVDYYVDTIQGHIIMSAVCSLENGNGVSISSVDIGTVEKEYELLEKLRDK